MKDEGRKCSLLCTGSYRKGNVKESPLIRTENDPIKFIAEAPEWKIK
jgi:hypothetical protein